MKLFLDDERFPPNDGEDWAIVRDVPEAIAYIVSNGCPSFISFDHDLGEDKKTGADLAKWMTEQDMDMSGSFFPEDFDFYIHSQNPVGAANIRGWLSGYLKWRNT